MKHKLIVCKLHGETDYRLLSEFERDIQKFFESTEDENDEVLLLNMNLEIAKNTILAMAPGQGRTPVDWHTYSKIDELCFPKIFAGQPFDTN